MLEYKVIQTTSFDWRDGYDKALEALQEEVLDHIKEGWEPLGGVALSASGRRPYAAQAVTRRPLR